MTGEETATVVRLNTARDALKSALEMAKKIPDQTSAWKITASLIIIEELIKELEAS